MAKLGNTIGLVGDRELQKTLLGLNDGIVKQVMTPAMRAGLKPVKRKAQEKAQPGAVLSPEASGLMRKAIRSSARSKKNGVVAKVFVSRDVQGEVNGKKHVPGNVAHLVEFGHGGPNPAPPHPFLRPALDESRTEAMAQITAKAKQTLPLAVAKAKAKNKSIGIGAVN